LITTWQAQMIAAPLLPAGPEPALEHPLRWEAFDLGYVLWRKLPPALPDGADVGAARVVVDGATGEPSIWPSSSVPMVIDLYRAHRARTPVHPLTYDPVAQAEYDRVHAPFPQRRTELVLGGGQRRSARGMTGDPAPRPHPIVRDLLAGLPAGQRERGGDRCSEVHVISDLLYAEDARREPAGLPPLRAADLPEQVFRDATIGSTWIREPGDPMDGQPSDPCSSCAALLRLCGFAPPSTEQR
jgi:hypothetical protein